MFGNVGGKIKGLGIFVCIFEVTLFIIYGVVWSRDTNGLSLLIALIGIIIAWVSALFIYGFGELIERVCSIEEKLDYNYVKTPDRSKANHIPPVSAYTAYANISSGWACSCGKVLPKNVSSCSCGKSKSEVFAERQAKQS